MDESNVEFDDVFSEQQRYLGEENWHEVCSPGVDSLAAVGADEEGVTAEDAWEKTNTTSATVHLHKTVKNEDSPSQSGFV